MYAEQMKKAVSEAKNKIFHLFKTFQWLLMSKSLILTVKSEYFAFS